MNKTVKYARNGLVIGAVGLGVYNLYKQFENREPGQSFDWRDFFLSVLKGGAIGGAIGGGVGLLKDYFNSMESPIDADAVLGIALGELRLKKCDDEYIALRSKSDLVINILSAGYDGLLYKQPFRFGSTEQGTALKEDFDIDVCVAFKPDAFASISAMFFSVLNTLRKYEGLHGIVKVRDQKKSIGVFFIIDGCEMKIDVVPQKLTKKKGKLSAGYLFVNRNGLFEKSSRTKTDINLLNSLPLSEAQNKILLTLKKWKTTKEVPISSHLLKYLVLEAYADNRGFIPKSQAKKTIMVLEYIRDNIEVITVNSIENTNNILTDISAYDKRLISEMCNDVIEDYNYQPNSIVQLIK